MHLEIVRRENDNHRSSNGTPTLISRSLEQNNRPNNSVRATIDTAISLLAAATDVEAMRSDEDKSVRQEEEGAQGLYSI